MAESRLIERKVSSKLRAVAETAFAVRAPIGPWRMKSGPRYFDAGVPTPDESWRVIGPGETWRADCDATWFIATAVVPEEWRGGPLIARMEAGGESQVFVDGELRQGLNAGRDEVPLSEEARPGARFEIALEAAPVWTKYKEVANEAFNYAEIVVPRLPVSDFLYWAEMTFEAAVTFAEGSTERVRMVRLLDEALKKIELRKAESDEYLGQVSAGSEEIRQGLAEIGPGGPGSAVLVGHAHIDTAWLWPLSEPKRKCGRTFSNVLRLMEQYPEFRFSQSQPQLYKFTKQCFPEMYEEIKARIAEGRWEPMGGAWVECDCNMPGGEAMIRQLLYGKRFFQEEFDKDTVVGWWPDAFGYPWSMPEILAHCGMQHFFSTKISWSQYNTFPHGLFWWQGLDGTRLLSFHAAGSYNGAVTPKELTALWRSFPERDRADSVLQSYGHGDGGGGPTPSMIERGKRLADMPGVPKCRFERANEFFAAVSEETAGIPTWNGELYLELHRGCQTTQARTKRGNRKLEMLLRDVEQLAAVTAAQLGREYPESSLHAAWEDVLCYQFHDILPGSSVRQVYAELEPDYARLMKEVGLLRDELTAALAEDIDTSGEGQAVVVFNTLGWERTDAVEIGLRLKGNEFHAVSHSGQKSPCQVLGRDGDEVRLLFLADAVPSMGRAVYHILPGPVEPEQQVGLSGLQLENEEVRLTLDEAGSLVGLYDKRADRDALAPQRKGNLLQCFDDRPTAFDAWDIDPWFEDQMWEIPAAESATVVEAGPLRSSLQFTRRTERSTFNQQVRLYAHSRRVEFVTHADWRERRTLLKVAFPVNVLSPQAAYEIQFGAIHRPTHHNTPWDRAKFEVPAHRWADLSETDYGVALLNDCKYGYDVRDNVLRLSLLRSPTDPDAEADQGSHDFTYALYPHSGGWQEGGVVRHGLELNAPLLPVAAASQEGPLPAAWSAASCSRANVVLETLKQAEDGSDLILRVYEAHGSRGPVEIAIALPVKSVVECNGMEEETGLADWREGRLRFDVGPWQIRSFKLRSG